MKKILLIIQREYLTRVKKKSFLLTTILVPLIIIGFYAAIIAISLEGSNEKKSIAIIDDTNLFEGKVDTSDHLLAFTLIKNEKDGKYYK